LENIHASVRADARDYFLSRSIKWHHWRGESTPSNRPTDHICCSQSSCVNTWFPYMNQPQLLAQVLSELGYPVETVLPFESDRAAGPHNFDKREGQPHYVCFEWIGERNYLQELKFGRVAPDMSRTRGEGFTSADFAFRFKTTDGQVQVVLGEWKYTEEYAVGAKKQIARSGTDRLRDIYGKSLDRPDCQIQLDVATPQEALFYDPFDQLMRLQLLASAMEREGELDADIVSVLHVAPKANTELENRITSPHLDGRSNDIHDLWNGLVKEGRFIGCHTEDLLPVIAKHAPDRSWLKYMTLRYGGMR